MFFFFLEQKKNFLFLAPAKLLSYFSTSTFQNDYNYWNNYFWSDFQPTMGADVCTYNNQKLFYFGPAISETRRFEFPIAMAQESTQILYNLKLCIITLDVTDLDIFQFSVTSKDDAQTLHTKNINYNLFSDYNSAYKVSCTSGDYRCKEISGSFDIPHIQNITFTITLLDKKYGSRYLLREIEIFANTVSDFLLINRQESKCQVHSKFMTTGGCKCDDGFFLRKLDSSLTCTLFPCGYCVPCHGICKTCDGNKINDCLSCWSNSIYDATQKTCKLAEKTSNYFYIIILIK